MGSHGALGSRPGTGAVLEKTALRRHPLTPLAVVAALVAYLLLRDVGHVVACIVLGVRFSPVLKYGFFPSVEILSAGASARSLAAVILGGPAATLTTGYLLLNVISRAPATPSGLGVLKGALCYLALVLDPLYFTVISLLNLGGEPEILTILTGFPATRMAILGLAVLALNLVLARRTVMPYLRGETDDEDGPAGTST
jgi:hypothetical protein